VIGFPDLPGREEGRNRKIKGKFGKFGTMRGISVKAKNLAGGMREQTSRSNFNNSKQEDQGASNNQPREEQVGWRRRTPSGRSEESGSG